MVGGEGGGGEAVDFDADEGEGGPAGEGPGAVVWRSVSGVLRRAKGGRR